MTPKIKWRVSSAPTGRYRSFQRRSWPTANYVTREEEIAVQILCEEDYVPSRVATGNHPPLTIWIADHSAKPVWKWVTLTRPAATLKEAKERVAAFLAKNPHFAPTPVTTQNVT
jgi:hypothetical protein